MSTNRMLLQQEIKSISEEVIKLKNGYNDLIKQCNDTYTKVSHYAHLDLDYEQKLTKQNYIELLKQLDNLHMPLKTGCTRIAALDKNLSLKFREVERKNSAVMRKATTFRKENQAEADKLITQINAIDDNIKFLESSNDINNAKQNLSLFSETLTDVIDYEKTIRAKTTELGIDLEALKVKPNNNYKYNRRTNQFPGAQPSQNNAPIPDAKKGCTIL